MDGFKQRGNQSSKFFRAHVFGRHERDPDGTHFSCGSDRLLHGNHTALIDLIPDEKDAAVWAVFAQLGSPETHLSVPVSSRGVEHEKTKVYVSVVDRHDGLKSFCAGGIPNAYRYRGEALLDDAKVYSNGRRDEPVKVISCETIDERGLAGSGSAYEYGAMSSWTVHIFFYLGQKIKPMEHLRQSILEAESKTGRRLTELRREFNKLAAGKLSKKNYKYIGTALRERKSANRKLMKKPEKGRKGDNGYGYDVDTCADACANKNEGYTIFGLEDAGECLCGENSDENFIEHDEFCYKNAAEGRKAKYRKVPADKIPPRMKHGEGGSAHCANLYELEDNSAPTLKDVAPHGNETGCWRAPEGTLNKTYENITPEECAHYAGNEPFAISAFGNENGRFTCHLIADKNSLVRHEKRGKLSKEITADEQSMPNLYQQEVCIDPDDTEHRVNKER